jgi:hypothetical protein
MVKRIAVAFSLLIVGVWGLSGCSKGASPVAPRTGNIQLSFPVAAIKAQVKSQNIVGSYSDSVIVKYHIVPQAGGEAIDGSKTVILSNNDNPVLAAALPGVGKYLVSVEVFNLNGAAILYKGSAKLSGQALTASTTDGTPILIGAEMIDVKESTSMSLRLGRLDTNCYQGYMNRCVTLTSGNGYSFDRSTGIADDQADCDIAVDTTGALVNNAAPTQPFIAYLGNGDMLYFTQLPADGRWYTSSAAAKGAPVSVGDVFVVKALTKTDAYAWMQVDYAYSDTYNYEYGFVFRYNDDGDGYCRFDMTSNGQIYCNDAILYGASNFQERRRFYEQLNGLDVDAAGNRYVANPSTHLVHVVDASGNTTDVGVSELLNPVDLAVGKSGATSIYVLDLSAMQVKVLDATGTRLRSINLFNNFPKAIATDSWGYVYVSFQDYTTFNGVVKYDPATGAGTSVVYNVGTTGAASDLYAPRGMAVDGEGNLFVADDYYGRVQKYDKDGNLVRQITELSNPFDVALDGVGGLWVSENAKAVKFDATTGEALTGFMEWYDQDGNYCYFSGGYPWLACSGGSLYTLFYDGQSGSNLDQFQQ